MFGGLSAGERKTGVVLRDRIGPDAAS